MRLLRSLVSERRIFIREIFLSSCGCGAASRVNPEAVVEYLPCLCTTLRSSLADTSWPIRDTAAISVGRFLRFNGPALAPGYFCNQSMKDDYSDKTENNMHEVVGDLLGMLFMCLREDPFRPVRESAAVGLVDICLSDDVGKETIYIMFNVTF